jgi:hypothetical protein
MRHLHLVLLIGLTSICFAQNSATIAGRVVDSNTQQVLGFAAIELRDSTTNQVLTAILADEEGGFTIESVPRGIYLVHISDAGYLATDQELTVGLANDIFNLGDIDLQPSNIAVEEIVVTGTAFEFEEGVRSFSLADNAAFSGGSVLDAMRGLPGITVDQEGQVLLRGSDRVTVLIDGKPSALTGYGNQSGLGSIPSANVESIQIINNPSSRYDAAGLAGVINIVYKDDRSYGWTGDFSFTAAVGQLDKRKEDLPTELGSFSNNFKYTPAISLNYGGENFDYYFQAEVLSQDFLPNNEFTTRFYDNGDVTLSQVPENRDQTHYIVKTGVDWAYSPDDTITASMLWDYEEHVDIAQVPFIDQASDVLLRYWFWREEEVTGFFNLNLGWEHAFAEVGRELSASIQFTQGWEDESYFLNEESPIRIGTDETHLDAKEYTVPLQIDYVHPLANGRLELGSKLQKRWLPVTYDIVPGTLSVIYPGLGDESEWGENIYAGYMNYVLEEASYGVEAGFRLEQTEVYYDVPPTNIYYADNDEYDYFEVYPNLRFTYNLDLDNSLSLHFNSRVDRPGEPELRVFPKYDDPELSKTGNPYLRPQFTKTYELAYQRFWETGSAYVALYHRDIEDTFQRLYAPDTSNLVYPITHKIYQNTGESSNDGIELTLSQDINAIWSLNGSLNWYQNKIDGDTVEVLFPFVRDLTIAASEDDTWDFKLNNQLSLPYDTALQLSYIYYGDRNIPQGTAKARSSFDIGLNKSVLEGRGELTFSFSDVFNSFGIDEEYEADGYVASYQNYYESQIARLSLTYDF